jgi:flagellar hook-associated protein 2
MGRITTNVGLLSGIPTKEIIDQLIAVQSGRLTTINNEIGRNTQIQTALNTVSARVLSLQAAAGSLGNSSVINAKSATSSNDSVLKVSASVSAALGSFSFRVLSLAATQQVVSTGVVDADTTPIGAGTISIKNGGFVDETLSLSLLNGGAGVSRGKVRLTDAEGKTAVVDFSTARTVNDVLEAINNATSVDVQASVSGDAFVLTDMSGGGGDVEIEEVGLGSTAADLGLLAGTLSGGGSKLTGASVVRVGSISLSALNDGLGVRDVAELDDFRIDLRDGATSIGVDISSAKTVAEVIDLINNDDENSGALVASLAADGLRIVLDDSSGVGALSVTDLNGGRAGYDLGLTQIVDTGGSLSGGRLIGSLAGPLLRNINGGSGIAALEEIRITDRTGAAADIDLSGAETLDDVISAINAANIAVTASINRPANGIEIQDTSGATASDLIVADLGGSTFAADLNLAGSYAADSASTGDVNFRFVSHNTSLDQLNGGKPIVRGIMRISDSNGMVTTIDLASVDGKKIQSVGQLLEKINSGTANVTARINDTGDGILIVNNAAGSQNVSVTDSTGAAAKAIGILGSAAAQINGSLKKEIVVSATDTLNDVLASIKASGAPVTASIINDGAGVNPFHLLITSANAGRAGRVLIDTGTVGIGLSTITAGADALLQYGSAANSAASLLVSSSSNTFSNILDGVTLTATGVSDQTINVSVSNDTSQIKTSISAFVANFNTTRTAIQDATFFDPETETRGILQGDLTVRRLEIALFDMVSKNYGAATSGVRNLADLGLRLKDGRLLFDEAAFDTRYSADPANTIALFEKTQGGAAKAMEDILKAFTSAVDGTITTRTRSLDDQNSSLEDQVDRLTLRLEQQRIRLEDQFIQMEMAIAKVNSLEGTLTQLQQLAEFAQSVGSKKK